MARVRLARGSSTAIKSSQGVDGRIYLAKDNYKIYADFGIDGDNTQVKRAELNQGVAFKINNLVFNNSESATSTVITDLDLTADTTMVFVMGEDPNYFDNKISCTAITKSDTEINKYILTFTASKAITLTIQSISIFAYSATNAIRSTNVPIDNTIVDWEDYIDTTGLYSKTYPANVMSTDDIILTPEAGNIVYAQVGDGMITGYGVTELSDMDISQYTTILPEGNVVNTIINYETLALENITGDETLYNQIIIQPVYNEAGYDKVNGYEWRDGQLYATLVEGEELTEHISIVVMLLTTNNTTTKEVSLTSDNWVEDNGVFINNIDIELECANDLPPIINSLDNNAEYNYITDIMITDTGIICTASSKPTSDINLMIIDFINAE